MSNGRNFNRGSAAVLVKDITVVNDYSFIVHKVRLYPCPWSSIALNAWH